MKKKDIKKIVGQIVEGSFKESGEVNETSVQLYLARMRDLSLSSALPMLKEYLRQMKRKILEYTLQIETAVPLTSGDIAYVTKVFKSGQLVSKVETKINKALLGGIRIKVGDKVYDDSVARKIQSLKGAL